MPETKPRYVNLKPDQCRLKFVCCGCGRPVYADLVQFMKGDCIWESCFNCVDCGEECEFEVAQLVVAGSRPKE